eukprot:scaffold8520_cov78-Skeletonema_marinoi.AAC.1
MTNPCGKNTTITLLSLNHPVVVAVGGVNATKAIFSEGGRRVGPEHESSIATRVRKATRHAKAGHKIKRVLQAGSKSSIATALSTT